MSMFKNTQTGDITTVFGPLHDNFAARGDQELIFDDRDALRDPLTEPLDVKDDEPAEIVAAPTPSGRKPEISQESPNPDAVGVDNPKE